MKPVNISVVRGTSMTQEQPDFSLPSIRLPLPSIDQAIECMNNARSNPQSVPRQRIFCIAQKITEQQYVQRSEEWEQLKLKAGDIFTIKILLSEFLLPEFRSEFGNDEQYLAWALEISNAVETYGQSIESFFLNHDGTLNYADMIVAVKKMIKDDVMNPIQTLKENNRKKLKYHGDFIRYSSYLSDLCESQRRCLDYVLNSYLGKSICVGGMPQQF